MYGKEALETLFFMKAETHSVLAVGFFPNPEPLASAK
jgi:hypothetical protein